MDKTSGDNGGQTISIGNAPVYILQNGTYVPLTQDFLTQHGWVLERESVFAGKQSGKVPSNT